MAEISLTDDQSIALSEILAARISGRRHLLTGYAGTGKTTLMQEVVREFLSQKLEVILTAPTHKAVAVLRKKIEAAELSVDCRTIHSLLSLRPVVEGPKTKLRRNKKAKHVSDDVVVIDECSMLDTELMGHIKRHLGHVFVLYVGDPAQLPPVNEPGSLSFQTESKSNLGTIVRQAAGNPVIQAAHIIRESQRGRLNMSWCVPRKAKPYGVYVPNGQTDAWMHKAFTSAEFRNDNDAFRYLCWTNERVAEVNSKIRCWIYGKTEEPFSVDENVLIRAPILSPINPAAPFDERAILFNTNEEAPVLEICHSQIEYRFCSHVDVRGWGGAFLAWEVVLQHPTGNLVKVKIPKDFADFDAVNNKLVSEAKIEHARWAERHAFAEDIARLQSVYALTVHNSQGSTFKNTFVDVRDIGKRARTNVLETQQLFYVAATRASHALMLVNV